MPQMTARFASSPHLAASSPARSCVRPRQFASSYIWRTANGEHTVHPWHSTNLGSSPTQRHERQRPGVTATPERPDSWTATRPPQPSDPATGGEHCATSSATIASASTLGAGGVNSAATSTMRASTTSPRGSRPMASRPITSKPSNIVPILLTPGRTWRRRIAAATGRRAAKRLSREVVGSCQTGKHRVPESCCASTTLSQNDSSDPPLFLRMVGPLLGNTPDFR